MRRVLTCLLAAVLAITLLPTMAGARSDWRPQLGATEQVEVQQTPVAVKAAAVAQLRGIAPDPVLDAVVTTLTAYVDERRPTDSTAARSVFDAERDLAVELQERLNRGTDPVVLDAAAALLQASRATTATLVSDLRVTATYGGADGRDLEQAERLLGQGEDAWRRGQPVSAVQHWRQAADRALGALERAGLRYAEDADADGDGVPDLLELAFKASPFTADTDGDGLTDAFEIGQATGAHSPALADTDGDGVPDGAEDEDGDGLDAAGEQAAGSSPLEPDTDGDVASDGAEVAAGTDPTTPDASVGTTTVADAATGIRVELTGIGDLAGRLRIGPPALPLPTAPGQVGAAVQVDLLGGPSEQLDTARLVLPFDPAAVPGDPADLRVFTYDEELSFWVPAGSDPVVDPIAGTVAATVPHFSIFAIFDVRNWQATFTALGGSCEGRSGGGGGGEPVFADVAFVLDSSGSMSSNDPQGLRRTASIEFVDALLAEDRGTVVRFSSSASLLQALTSDKALLRSAISRVGASGGTNIGAGVSTGLSALAANTDDTRAQLMILLTDGVGSYNRNLTPQAAAAGVTIYTIGLGQGVDDDLLIEIAEGTGGQYYPVAQAEDLPEVFREIEEDTGDDGRDTDGDGLSDCDEEEGVSDGSGLVFTSDPRLEDTDGDGLLDGDEVSGEPSDLARLLLGPLADELDVRTIFSDPRLEDTDGDGLTDPEEADLGTRARGNDSDDDLLEDSLESQELGTDPTRHDSDGDGLDDGFEHLNAAAGFDPQIFDEQQSRWAYAGDFVLGGVCPLGWSFCERDSLAWLAGSIGGGFLVYKDVLDIIGGITTLDVVGTGLSAVALVPAIGDASSVVVKGVRFVTRVSRKGGDALAYLLKLGDLPLVNKVDLLRQVDATALRRLQDAGLSETQLVAFVSKRVDFRVLARAVENAADLRQSPQLYRRERQAEQFLRSSDPGALPRQVGFPPPNRPATARGTSGYRYPDVYNPTTQVAIEVKNGYWDDLPYVKAQIAKDVALRSDPNTAIQRVEWHFFPRTDGTVGPSDALRDLLQRNGIPYVLHLP